MKKLSVLEDIASVARVKRWSVLQLRANEEDVQEVQAEEERSWAQPKDE